MLAARRRAVASRLIWRAVKEVRPIGNRVLIRIGITEVD